MIQHSDTIGEIMTAIRNVQKKVDHVTKDEKNPHFGNTYTKLNTFLRELAGPMEDHGLVMSQAPGMEDGNVTVETFLYHESGEWIRNVAAAPMQKPDPQGVGSAITYLSRYSLAALFALPQEDDDGNAASGNPSRKQGGGQNQSGPECPKCNGQVWDNRQKKEKGDFSEKSPDYACRDKEGCGWAFWIDGATEQLEAALDGLVGTGTINEAAKENVLDGVRDGNLDSFRIAQDWVRQKQKEANQG